MRCHAWIERLQIEKRPVEQTGSTGRKVLEALETGVQPPIEPAIVETTQNGRSRAPPAASGGFATPGIQLAGSVRSWVDSAAITACPAGK